MNSEHNFSDALYMDTSYEINKTCLEQQTKSYFESSVVKNNVKPVFSKSSLTIPIPRYLLRFYLAKCMSLVKHHMMCFPIVSENNCKAKWLPVHSVSDFWLVLDGMMYRLYITNFLRGRLDLICSRFISNPGITIYFCYHQCSVNSSRLNEAYMH